MTNEERAQEEAAEAWRLNPSEPVRRAPEEPRPTVMIAVAVGLLLLAAVSLLVL